jgi:hypothetical protein
VTKGRKLVLGIVAIAAVSVLAGCSDKTHGDQSTLKLTEGSDNSGTFGVIGNATDQNAPPGSGFAFSTPLLDSSNKTVGQLDATCIATAPSPGRTLHGQCTGTATVEGGTLALNVGGKDVGENITGAITGGTGKYEGATGSFTSVNGANNTSADTFDITLP